MRVIPILNALKHVPELARFIPYMVENSLQVEKTLPNLEHLNESGYNMASFAADNQLVMTWFTQCSNALISGEISSLKNQ